MKEDEEENEKEKEEKEEVEEMLLLLLPLSRWKSAFFSSLFTISKDKSRKEQGTELILPFRQSRGKL